MPAPAPHPCERLLAGWFRCYWLCHPTSPNGHNGYTTNHPLHHTTDNTPAAPSRMSNCSWGGSRLEWQRGQQVAAMREEKDKRHHTTHPQPHKQLLVGWVVGGTTVRLATGKDNNNNAEHHSTYPHAYKQLLVGWMMGAVCYTNDMTTTGRGYHNDDACPQQHKDHNASTNTNSTRSRMTRHPPHAHKPLLMGWLTDCLSMTKGTTRCLPPHLQAAARRVVHRCSIRETNTSTCPHCCTCSQGGSGATGLLSDGHDKYHSDSTPTARGVKLGAMEMARAKMPGRQQ
jgi:hypothetical protein